AGIKIHRLIIQESGALAPLDKTEGLSWELPQTLGVRPEGKCIRGGTTRISHPFQSGSPKIMIHFKG
ncbi:MAG TPA: hypothetical protein VIV15_03120, partial [Anaerolineales bacterium]